MLAKLTNKPNLICNIENMLEEISSWVKTQYIYIYMYTHSCTHKHTHAQCSHTYIHISIYINWKRFRRFEFKSWLEYIYHNQVSIIRNINVLRPHMPYIFGFRHRLFEFIYIYTIMLLHSCTDVLIIMPLVRCIFSSFLNENAINVPLFWMKCCVFIFLFYHIKWINKCIICYCLCCSVLLSCFIL